MIVPNAESALNEEAGKLLLERYDDYSQRAKMITEIHAQPAKSATSCSSSSSSGGGGGGAASATSTDADTAGDDGPMSKKHALDKKAQDKKKEKLIKEKKRILKRL